jgi:hypothetical protein
MVIRQNALEGVITDVRPGSPNLLLQVPPLTCEIPPLSPTSAPTFAPTFAPTVTSAPTSCNHQFRLELLFDKYSNDTTWDLQNPSNVIVATGSGYYDDADESIESVNETICIDDGEYTFTIYDSYWDGMCCEQGNGSYSIFLDDMEVPVKHGGKFKYSETTYLEGLSTAPSTSPSTAPVGAKGDPHFSTWKGEHYDYHGKCDLELVSDPIFANGKGLDVHIRTEIVRQWSYIKYSAIRIGNDILEVEGGADDNHYWFNKVYQGELTTLSGFPVKYKKANSKQHVYTIDLGNQEEISISTFKDFVRIDFKEPTKSRYGNTVGLLADFNTGKKLGRDGFTIIEDYNDFGQEWQVLADGPKLFHEISGRQFPGQKCVLPSELHAEEKHRRGQEKRIGRGTPNTVTETIAELACAKVFVLERDACVSDVLITGDVDMAGAY